jgi:ATP-binding cassette, subfamily B, multidrug efflux pump
MKIILNLLKPFKYRLALSLTMKSIAALSDLLLPWIIAYMIDEIIPDLRLQTDPSLRPLYIAGLVMVVISFLGVIFNISANRTAEYIAAMAIKDLRHDLFEKIENLSANQVDSLTRPSLISRMTTDTYNVYRATAVMQRLGVRAPILLIGGILMSLLLDPILTLVMISILPLVLVIVYFTSKKGIPLYKKTQKKVDVLVRTLREYITGSRVVRALSMNQHEMDRFDRANQDTVDAELKPPLRWQELVR